MNTTAIARIELTQEELRAAWIQVHRDSWPATFEEAMQDAVCSRIVRMRALHPPPLEIQPVPVLQAAASVQSHQAHAARFHKDLPPDFVDFKRRASGERDDD